MRPIEWAVEGRDDLETEAVRDYCAAVSPALADDGRPPLGAPGLRLQRRLEKFAARQDRVAGRLGHRRS
jgi:hypothetical protein